MKFLKRLIRKKGGARTMKTFLEEYGVIVVAAIVIMVIVVFASPLGNMIKNGITNTVTKLTTSMESGVNGSVPNPT